MQHASPCLSLALWQLKESAMPLLPCTSSTTTHVQPKKIWIVAWQEVGKRSQSKAATASTPGPVVVGSQPRQSAHLAAARAARQALPLAMASRPAGLAAREASRASQRFLFGRLPFERARALYVRCTARCMPLWLSLCPRAAALAHPGRRLLSWRLARTLGAEPGQQGPKGKAGGSTSRCACAARSPCRLWREALAGRLSLLRWFFGCFVPPRTCEHIARIFKMMGAEDRGRAAGRRGFSSGGIFLFSDDDHSPQQGNPSMHEDHRHRHRHASSCMAACVRSLVAQTVFIQTLG
jgi:hypothetical protein